MSTPKKPDHRLQATESQRLQGVAGNETKRPSDSVPVVAATFANLPSKFGRYQIERLLGRGAMGAVYLARDTQLDRQVALKIPKVAASGSKRLLVRLETEAKAAAQLDHPSLCKVFDAGEINGQCFIAMQYIDGETLKSQLEAQRKSVKESMALILHLAEGLSDAHDLGIIHRDLKPENIMINRRGIPVIMDFGLAKFSTMTASASATQAGTILGSPGYMSPEQASGKVAEIDHRSDIYALGVILFELLTGKWPFEGSAMQILGQKSLLDPPSPLSVNPDLPPQLATVCHKMIAKTNATRYQNLGEIIHDLKGINLNAPTPATATAAPPAAAPPTDLSALPGVIDFTVSSLDGDPIASRSASRTSMSVAVSVNSGVEGISVSSHSVTRRKSSASKTIWIVSISGAICLCVLAFVLFSSPAKPVASDRPKPGAKPLPSAAVTKPKKKVVSTIAADAAVASTEHPESEREKPETTETRDPEPMPEKAEETASNIPMPEAEAVADTALFEIRNGDFRDGLKGWDLEGGAANFKTFPMGSETALTTFGSKRDADTGRMSQTFKIPENATELEWYVHGCTGPHTYVALLLGTELYKRADAPNGNNPVKVKWDLHAIRGKMVTLEIVDRATGPRGYIGAHGFKILTEDDFVDTATGEISFFNGRNLNGWKGLDGLWSVRNGALEGSTLYHENRFNTCLCSDREYGDFELKCKVKLSGPATANSGILFRGEVIDKDQFIVKGPQCDIGPGYWGSVYYEGGGMLQAANQAVVKRVLNPDDFNELFLQCQGRHVLIKLNGQTTVDKNFPNIRLRGVIGWQLHAGPASDLSIKDLEFKELASKR